MHSGKGIRNIQDERSFVIEPLLEADPYSRMPGFRKKTHLKNADAETERLGLESPSDDDMA
jgi:retron-type reverse transcriptase